MPTPPTHTKTPWHLHDMETRVIVGPDHLSIGICEAKSRSTDEDVENAAFIVRAVNAHEALLDSLKLAVTQMKEAHMPVALFEQAIAKAEGK